MAAKLSAELEQRLQSADASSLLEIVVELRPALEEAGPAGPASRSERIAARKADAERCFAPLEEEILRVGGEVTGHAWINKTLRARLPAKEVLTLCRREEIATLDIPHVLRAEQA